MLNIAHRGASGHEPENSLEAFQKAVDLGADMVEMDVRLCKSGEIVVMHDKSISRTTNGTGIVSEMTLAELKAVEIDRSDPEDVPIKKGEQIPTLKEAIDLLLGKAKICIEIKDKNMVETLIELLSQPQYDPDNFLVISFLHDELKVFKGLMPEVKTGAVFAVRQKGDLEYFKKIGVDTIHPAFAIMDEALIEDAHNEGFKYINVWTVNTPKDIEEAKRLGATGFTSNYPKIVSDIITSI